MSIHNDEEGAEIVEEALPAVESSSNENTERDSKNTSKRKTERRCKYSLFPTIKESQLRGLSPESRKKKIVEFNLKHAEIYEQTVRAMTRLRKEYKELDAKNRSKYTHRWIDR